MKQFIRDLTTSLKGVIKLNIERLKLLVMIAVIITSTGSGIYGIYYSLMNGVYIILIFIVSVIGIWFGVGMLDMFRDMVKFNK